MSLSGFERVEDAVSNKVCMTSASAWICIVVIVVAKPWSSNFYCSKMRRTPWKNCLGTR